MRIVIKGMIDNTHMGMGHVGLHAFCLKNFEMDLTKLKPGEVVVFLNRTKDKMKLIGASGKCLAYLRQPRGERIDLDAIQYLPQAFGGQGFDYDAALRKSLLAKLSNKYDRKAKPDKFWGNGGLKAD